MTLSARSLILPLLLLLLGAAIATLVYNLSLQAGLDQLQRTTQARLAQSNDRFLGQVTRFQQLVNSLARHPKINQATAGQGNEDLTDLLLKFALSSGAGNVFLVDRQGTVVASSDFLNPERPGRVGSNLKSTDFIESALGGGLGWSHGIESGPEPRILYFSRAVFGAQGPVIGAVVVSVSVDALEFEWSFGLEPVAYFDQAGVIFVTNRPQLALLHDPDMVWPEARSIQFSTAELRPIFDYRKTTLFGHRIWRGIDSDVLPDTALVLTRYLPRVELQSAIFRNTRPVQERAFLFATLSASMVALLGLGVWVANLRRRALAEQLLSEEAAKEQLEIRVEERTQELREAQKQLVAAGRLSALGEMSAGISHELNQPLAAMQNFAENGKKLLAKGKTEQAGQNFELLREQVDRIGRIIRSLRAFARNEEQEIRPVDVGLTVEKALSISHMRIKREGISISLTGLDQPIWVHAGEVRLQQVLVNIFGNAMDALSAVDERKIMISAKEHHGKVELRIADSGPGIAAPDQVFEPFYSTKDPGSSKGMGLGLSISHGIIGSFAGTLTCRNRPKGGAEFTITLPKADSEA